MNMSLEIYSDLVLSANGEDIQINADGKDITVEATSMASAVKTFLIVHKEHQFYTGPKDIDVILRRLDLTVYARLGFFRAAVLGAKGKTIWLRLLIFFGRLIRPK